jgi:aldose 1-epimerase
VSLRHPSGLALDLMTTGATWLSCLVPMQSAQHMSSRRQVILSYDSIEDYAKYDARMGAIIGRFANRIANGRIEQSKQNGSAIVLSRHQNQRHHLHGGVVGFDRRLWCIAAQSEAAVTLTMLSEDGDQGYPGELNVSMTVSLSDARQITLSVEAVSSKTTPVSISHHPYFNLDAVHQDVRDHRLQIAATHMLPVDEALIPLGRLTPLSESSEAADFDFRQPKSLRRDWLSSPQQVRAGGYDHSFLLNCPVATAHRSIAHSATLISADGKLQLRVSTDLPALHLYTGQYLPTVAEQAANAHGAYAGVALEPGFLPDSPNHPEWPQPSCWLQAGETYSKTIRYDFDAE